MIHVGMIQMRDGYVDTHVNRGRLYVTNDMKIDTHEDTKIIDRHRFTLVPITDTWPRHGKYRI